MAKISTGHCGKCRIELTKENCRPSAWIRKVGNCHSCQKEYNKNLHIENFERYKVKSRIYRESLSGRHQELRRALKEEGVPTDDLLWNQRFYFELIQDNRCYYCLGSLNPTSHGLDCINNELGHVVFNVVPCCKSCNQKKSNDVTYEEMMLLVPALREIRRRRGK
jgi:hypothetical protein